MSRAPGEVSDECVRVSRPFLVPEASTRAVARLRSIRRAESTLLVSDSGASGTSSNDSARHADVVCGYRTPEALAKVRGTAGALEANKSLAIHVARASTSVPSHARFSGLRHRGDGHRRPSCGAT